MCRFRDGFQCRLICGKRRPRIYGPTVWTFSISRRLKDLGEAIERAEARGSTSCFFQAKGRKGICSSMLSLDGICKKKDITRADMEML